MNIINNSQKTLERYFTAYQRTFIRNPKKIDVLYTISYATIVIPIFAALAYAIVRGIQACLKGRKISSQTAQSVKNSKESNELDNLLKNLPKDMPPNLLPLEGEFTNLTKEQFHENIKTLASVKKISSLVLDKNGLFAKRPNLLKRLVNRIGSSKRFNKAHPTALLLQIAHLLQWGKKQQWIDADVNDKINLIRQQIICPKIENKSTLEIQEDVDAFIDNIIDDKGLPSFKVLEEILRGYYVKHLPDCMKNEQVDLVNKIFQEKSTGLSAKELIWTLYNKSVPNLKTYKELVPHIQRVVDKEKDAVPPKLLCELAILSYANLITTPHHPFFYLELAEKQGFNTAQFLSDSLDSAQLNSSITQPKSTADLLVDYIMADQLPIEPQKLKEYCEKAKTKESKLAEACCLAEGFGVPQNREEAVKLLTSIKDKSPGARFYTAKYFLDHRLQNPTNRDQWIHDKDIFNTLAEEAKGFGEKRVGDYLAKKEKLWALLFQFWMEANNCGNANELANAEFLFQIGKQRNFLASMNNYLAVVFNKNLHETKEIEEGKKLLQEMRKLSFSEQKEAKKTPFQPRTLKDGVLLTEAKNTPKITDLQDVDNQEKFIEQYLDALSAKGLLGIPKLTHNNIYSLVTTGICAAMSSHLARSVSKIMNEPDFEKKLIEMCKEYEQGGSTEIVAYQIGYQLSNRAFYFSDILETLRDELTPQQYELLTYTLAQTIPEIEVLKPHIKGLPSERELLLLEKKLAQQEIASDDLVLIKLLGTTILTKLTSSIRYVNSTSSSSSLMRSCMLGAELNANEILDNLYRKPPSQESISEKAAKKNHKIQKLSPDAKAEIISQIFKESIYRKQNEERLERLENHLNYTMKKVHIQNNDSDANAIKEILNQPEGVYRINLSTYSSGHGLLLIKHKEGIYLFDPNAGLIKCNESDPAAMINTLIALYTFPEDIQNHKLEFFEIKEKK